ncbi:hypothetical protein BDN67DRAFT_877501, partial [Paxillus ammoniavirescens]
MLIGQDMPKFLWAEVVSYASWLQNWLPLCATPDHTPYNLIHGHHPDLSRAHEFRCKVYIHIQDVRKLEARAKEAAFVGVDEESKG